MMPALTIGSEVRRRLQALQIRLRIVESVDMVDAHPVDHPLPDQLEGQAVRAVEHAGLIHAQRREVIDVEEPAVVDLVDRDAPVRQPVGLGVEQRIERVEAVRIAGCAVEPRERLRAIVDHGEEFGVLIATQRIHRDRRLLLQLAQQVLGGFDVARNGAGSRDRHGYAAGTRADAPVATVANASRRSETMVMKPSTFATSFRPLSVISSRTR